MRIFLTGFMGCGKTSVGKKLARKLNLRFIDLDSFIEEKAKLTIVEIFENKGEKYFRQLEQNSLKTICGFEDIVVSTGGGTPCFLNNMDLINKTGTSIYLKMDPLSLASRLKNAKTARPLIQNKSENELLDYIKKTLKSREKYYLMADFVINGINPDIKNIIKKITV